jgi:hypothetical protein
MRCRILAVLFTTMAVTASGAEQIGPCSLMTDADLIGLGVPEGAPRSQESQPGGVQACKFHVQDATGGMTVSILLSQDVPERALQLRALQAKVISESTTAELDARGEYYSGNVMCKVTSVSRVETSRCLGSTEKSVIAFTLVRPQSEAKVRTPTQQLQLTATLLSRLAARGG